MALCVVPMEGPNSVTILLFVARSYSGTNSRYAAVNAPEVTTLISSARAAATMKNTQAMTSAADPAHFLRNIVFSVLKGFLPVRVFAARDLNS